MLDPAFRPSNGPCVRRRDGHDLCVFWREAPDGQLYWTFFSENHGPFFFSGYWADRYVSFCFLLLVRIFSLHALYVNKSLVGSNEGA